MFTERHHIPLPVFVLLGKTNSSLFVFSHPISFLSLTHPPSPILHLLLCEYIVLTEPYTVFLAHSCILVLNLPICSRTVSLKLFYNHISPHFSTICSCHCLSSSAASSSLLSTQLVPCAPPAPCAHHPTLDEDTHGWCLHSVPCCPCFHGALPHSLQVPVVLPCS